MSVCTKVIQPLHVSFVEKKRNDKIPVFVLAKASPSHLFSACNTLVVSSAQQRCWFCLSSVGCNLYRCNTVFLSSGNSLIKMKGFENNQKQRIKENEKFLFFSLNQRGQGLWLHFINALHLAHFCVRHNTKGRCVRVCAHVCVCDTVRDKMTVERVS